MLLIRFTENRCNARRDESFHRRRERAMSSSYGAEDRDWDNFIYDNSVLAVVAAGNEGSTGNIVDSAKGLNVLSVGNYSDFDDTIYCGSSGLDPTNTKNRKPELSAPGYLINAGGYTYTGTSQAAPHVAGLLADLLQAQSGLRLKPYSLKAHAIASATDSISGGVDAVGEGGYDFLSGYWSWYDFWLYGNNAYFDTVAANDAVPTNIYVDKFVTLTQGQNVRAVLVWMNRGTYRYDHRNDIHPMGIDLDLTVYDPSGNWVASSASWDNPYEIANFSPSVSGSYRFEISRFANRDTSSRSELGLSVNF